MWNKIGGALLRTGETMEIYVIRTPDRDYEQEIGSFLSQTDKLWQWHLDLAIHGELDDLEARFYVGLLEGKIVSNVSTWERDSIGLVAHLLTAGQHRNKGACTALMKAQMHDFRNRGGKTLIGGFRPASYSIAKRLGFKSITDNSEVMSCESDPDFEREYFRAEYVSCRNTMWKDWPGISLLFTSAEGWVLRSMKHRIFGPFDYEDFFLEDMSRRLSGGCMSKVLASKKGSIVGYATLTFMWHQKNTVWLLDFFVHHRSASGLDMLLDAMDFPRGETRCFVEFKCHEKRRALMRRGFKEISKEQTRCHGKTVDTILMEY